MLREVVLASICFMLTSGCALTETGNPDESQGAAASAGSSIPEITGGEAAVTAPLPDTASASAGDKKFGPESIREIQSHLKRSGFYSGAVDGIAGAKTQTAIRHFLSGCATLNDLLPSSNPAAMRQTPEMTAKTVVPKTRNRPVEAIRVIQLRLKDAGFDPGPIDGIAGAKTQSAISALESGCNMLGDVHLMSPDNPRSPQLAPGKITRTSAANGGSENFTELPRGNSSREAIKALQRRLTEAGLDPGPADGILGPKTKAAAQRYQSSLQ